MKQPKPLTFMSVVDQFINSPKFAQLAESTASGWKRELLNAAHPDSLGLCRVESLRPSLVLGFIDGLTVKPGKQQLALSALRALESWAIVRDLIPFPITTGIKLNTESEGHDPWSDAQVELAERHATPIMSRAISLGANTGQRGSDLVRMGWSDLETYKGYLGINVIQKKTGLRIWIPITQLLQDIMSKWEKTPGPFLADENGRLRDLSRSALSTRWGWERDHNPELAPLRGMTLHGLRATAVVRLRQEGATVPQITDLIGMSEQMVKRYCRTSDQKTNAMAAVDHLDRRNSERAENKPATVIRISDKK